MRVMRGSAWILNSGPPSVSSLRAASSKRSASAPSRMVRNLAIRNVEPPRPLRRWRKSTGPDESSLIASAITASSGESTSSPKAAPATSTPRLSVRTLRDRRMLGRLTSGIPSRSSISAFDANSSA